jgi:hypothetical protein
VPQITVINGDTFAIVPIKDLKLANGIFVKEGMYKSVVDSMKSLILVYKDKILIKESEVATLQQNVENYKHVSELCETEKASLKDAYDKEVKDFKKYRVKATVVGVVGAVLLGISIVLAIAR